MQIKLNVDFQEALGAIKGGGGVPKISDKKCPSGEWGTCN